MHVCIYLYTCIRNNYGYKMNNCQLIYGSLLNVFQYFCLNPFVPGFFFSSFFVTYLKIGSFRLPTHRRDAHRKFLLRIPSLIKIENFGRTYYIEYVGHKWVKEIWKISFSLTHLCPDSFFIVFRDIAYDRLFSSTDS